MISSIISLYLASTEPILSVPSSTTSFVIETSATEVKPIQKDPKLLSPFIQAKAGLVVEKDSELPLFSKNADAKLPMASLTKLMTVLILLEENDLNEVVTVSEFASNAGGSEMDLVAGEKITVKNLIEGALIQSGNDAAIALAEHNAGSVENFVKKMNDRKTAMDLKNTNFTNPAGFDDYNHYSSAKDISVIAKEVYKYQVVRDAVKVNKKTVKSTNSVFQHQLISTNKLLNSYLKINGLKTGTTDSAGQCFVAVAENENNKEIFSIILNSPDRFQETKSMIDWSFRAYQL